MPMVFGTANTVIQPNSFNTLADLQAGRQPGGALIYTAITSSTFGGTVFYTDKTVATIISDLAT